jgi:hypothetical protein
MIEVKKARLEDHVMIYRLDQEVLSYELDNSFN